MINIPNAQITSLEQQLAEARAQVERLDNENTVFIVQIGELNQILLARADENERLKTGLNNEEAAKICGAAGHIRNLRNAWLGIIAARAAGGKE